MKRANKRFISFTLLVDLRMKMNYKTIGLLKSYCHRAAHFINSQISKGRKLEMLVETPEMQFKAAIAKVRRRLSIQGDVQNAYQHIDEYNKQWESNFAFR